MSDQKMPPLLFPSSDRTHRAWMAQLKKTSAIHQIGPRLYASVPKNLVVKTVRENWAQVVSNLFPSALLSYRSAIEYKPTDKGYIYLTSSTNREVKYPGLTLKFIRGPHPLADDIKFLNFYAASLPRAILENLATTRKKSLTHCLSREMLEEKLEEIIIQGGEDSLKQLRSRAKEIAEQFGWNTEFKKLDALVGSLLSTRSSDVLVTSRAKARAARVPYDPQALTKLEGLFAALRHYPFHPLKDNFSGRDHFRHKAFFEAYFSNYIEGTIFEIEEAEEIVFEKKIPTARPKDAHDVLHTYQLVSDPNELRQVPTTAGQLHSLLINRHKILMQDREGTFPGKYKEKPNRAGSTHFVHPDYVIGTLEKGFEYYKSLPSGLARATFMMFMVTEVHPFVDGNGRIARIMLNAELFANGLTSIIIPTVFREDYLGALRALSRRERPEPIIKMIKTAHAFSHLNFSSYSKALKYLEDHNWFEDPNEAKIIVDLS